jgi:phenylpropionate dioxygenase-like ring-hydroxylating dioxygenase large terminal subunit
MPFTAPVEQVGPGTPAGRLLRRHWQPVLVAHDLGAGEARPVRVLGEDLAVYRAADRSLHAIAGRCAHRGTLLHTGWVEDGCLRCVYHGWAYDGDGRCVDAPAEGPGFAGTVRIPGYPVREHADLVFVFLGDGSPPPLPTHPALEADGMTVVGGIRPPGPWPVNWFQLVENNVDPVHLSFVHRSSQPFTREIADFTVEAFDGGLAVVQRRSTGVRRTWFHFPQLIHIPMRPPSGEAEEYDFFNWVVPVDDEHSTFIAAVVVPPSLAAQAHELVAGRTMDEGAAEDLMAGRRRPTSTTEEDYVAMVGQGTVADRSTERLGRSDVGVVALRRLFEEALAELG